MPLPHRGEVWLADLGIAAKVRPDSQCPAGTPRSGSYYVRSTHHQRARDPVRGRRAETLPQRRSVRAQGLVTVAPARLLRRLGRLEPGELELVEEAVKRWLAL